MMQIPQTNRRVFTERMGRSLESIQILRSLSGQHSHRHASNGDFEIMHVTAGYMTTMILQHDQPVETNNGNNDGKYSNPEFDALVEKSAYNSRQRRTLQTAS